MRGDGCYLALHSGSTLHTSVMFSKCSSMDLRRLLSGEVGKLVIQCEQFYSDCFDDVDCRIDLYSVGHYEKSFDVLDRVIAETTEFDKFSELADSLRLALESQAKSKKKKRCSRK